MLANLSLSGLARHPRQSTPTSSRRITVPGRLPVSTLLYLVAVGFVAVATSGVFFGVGFSLLASPPANTIAGVSAHDPTRSDAGTQQADHGDTPDSEATSVSRSAAIAAGPLAQPPALDSVAQLSSAAPGSEPPTPTASNLDQPPARTVSHAPPIQVGPTPSANDSANSFGGKAADASQSRSDLNPEGGVRSSAGDGRPARLHGKLKSAERATPRGQQPVLSETVNRSHHGTRKTGALSMNPKHG
jgi:hypothetical protein